MIGKKIESRQYLPLFEVKDLLKERLDQNEKGVEPTYEQNLAKDYVKKFVKLSPAKAKKLFEDLRKLDYLDEKTAVKVSDIVPEDADVLALLIPREHSLDEAKQKEVLGLVAKYSK